jgi:hypothetical protein
MQRRNTTKLFLSGSMAELANVSVVHPKDPCSNLCTDRKYFLILFVLHLNLNLADLYLTIKAIEWFAYLGNFFKTTNLILSSGKTDFFNCWCSVKPHHFKMQHHSAAQPSWNGPCKPSLMDCFPLFKKCVSLQTVRPKTPSYQFLSLHEI